MSEPVFEAPEGSKRRSVFTEDEMRVLHAITCAYTAAPRSFSLAKMAKLFGLQNNVFTRCRENLTRHNVSFRMAPAKAKRTPFSDRALNQRHSALIEREVAKWLGLPDPEGKPKTAVDDVLRTAGDISEKRRRLLTLAQTSTNEGVRIQAEVAEDKLARAHSETEKGPGDPLTLTDQQTRLQMLMEAVGMESSIVSMENAFGGALTITRASHAERVHKEASDP